MLSRLVLLLYGLAHLALAGMEIAQSAASFDQLISQIIELQPMAILTLGVLAILLTPVLGLIIAMVSCLRAKDWLYSSIAGAVIAVICFGLARALFF